MELNLDGDVVIVTGGTSGLGYALAAALVSEHARVVICGRDRDRLARATRMIESDPRGGGEVVGVRADVTDPDDVARLVSTAVERWGRIDGLVNNAGATRAMRLEDSTDEDWCDDFELKVLAAVRLTRLAIPELRRSGGAVVNVLSIGAKAPGAASMPTTVSRAAGLALTKALATDLAPDGVRVNAICVGLIESGQWTRLAGQREMPVELLQQQLVEQTGVPLGRIGRAGEFADLGLFLLSERSSYLTGAAVNLDGGASPVP